MRYEELNDEVDLQLLEATARIVSPLVLVLDVRLRLAVNNALRNLYAGFEVGTNPRRPETQDADYARAKVVLAPKLIMRGLLTREDVSDWGNTWFSLRPEKTSALI